MLCLSIHLHTLEDVEVVLVMMRFGRYDAAKVRVPYNHIGIRPLSDQTLSRVHVEDLSSTRRSGLDELIFTNQPFADSLGPNY